MSFQSPKHEIDPILNRLQQKDEDLRQVVEKMRRDQEKFRALFNRSLHCTYIHDLQGRFLDANDAALNLFGYDREEALSLNFAALIDGEQLPRALSVLEEIKQNGCQQNFSEYRLKKKDGSYVWIETDGSLIYCNGKPYAVLGVARDVTARKKANEAIIASEAKYRQIVEHAPTGIYEITLSNNKFARVNDVMCQVTGYSREEFLTLEPSVLLTEKSRKLMAARAAGLFAGEKIPEKVELEIRTKDGRVLWILATTRIIYEDGIPTSASVVATDISDQKQTEMKLKEKDKKLKQQAQHLKEVNTALKVLLEHRDDEKQKLEENMVVNFKRLIFPYIDKLENSKLDLESRTYLDIIKSNLEDISSPLTKVLSDKYLAFTPSEIQIADLIKHGKTSKEIAGMLNISPQAVGFHRGNIRKKLDLTNKKISLKSHLQSFPM